MKICSAAAQGGADIRAAVSRVTNTHSRLGTIAAARRAGSVLSHPRDLNSNSRQLFSQRFQIDTV